MIFSRYFAENIDILVTSLVSMLMTLYDCLLTHLKLFFLSRGKHFILKWFKGDSAAQLGAKSWFSNIFNGGNLLLRNIFRVNMIGITSSFKYTLERDLIHPAFEIINVQLAHGLGRLSITCITTFFNTSEGKCFFFLIFQFLVLCRNLI